MNYYAIEETKCEIDIVHLVKDVFDITDYHSISESVFNEHLGKYPGYLKWQSGTVQDKPQAEKDSTDLQRFENDKNERFKLFDMHTDQMIVDMGFEYPDASGQVFGLDNKSKIYWLGLDPVNDPSPVIVSTVDGVLVALVKADILPFQAAAKNIIKDCEGSEYALRLQVESMHLSDYNSYEEAKEALDAIIDNR